MKLKMKRFMAPGIAAVMTAFLLAGCGDAAGKTESPAAPAESTASQEETSEEASDDTESASDPAQDAAKAEITFPLEETMEFTGLSIMANSFYYKDNLAWNEALQRANINIELTEIMRSEIEEKGNLLMQSGDYPDMLFKVSALDLDTYGIEGMLIPLEDLIREYAPNLTKLLDERNGWNAITAPDGHVYSLPNVDSCYMQDFSTECLWLNKRWLDNLELEEPGNMDELYEVLKAFKEKDANGNGDPDDEIPFTFVDDINIFMAYLDDGLHYADNYCNVADGKLEFYPLTEGYKNNYLAYFTKMYEEGILDANGFTQTADQLNALGKSGDIYGMFRRSTTLLVPEENQYDYVALKPFNGADLPLSSGVSKGGLAITDKCGNPEVLIAWADYLYSEEGGRLAYLGIEGTNYTVNDGGTYSKIEGDFEDSTFQCTLNGLATTPAVVPELSKHPDPEGDPYTAYVYEERDKLYQGTIMPTLAFTQEESERLSTLQTDIFTYIKNYSAEVITGQKSLDDTWDGFQTTLKDMGAEELESLYQAAYERGSAE